MAQEYRAKLKDKKEVAKDTMEFVFEKPSGLNFRAGNSFDLTLLNPTETDAEGNTRAFSCVAAPYEDWIGFATRMRDTAFKRVIKNLPIGSEIKLEGPFGSFNLHNDASRAGVFLAGGIGITPFMSMIKQATHEKTPHKLFLFYANHTRADAAFLDELQDLEKENQNFKLIAIMTQDATWSGEKGHIDRAMLEKYIGDLATPIFYSAGPPDMVATLKKVMLESGVNEDNIRTEDFSGY